MAARTLTNDIEHFVQYGVVMNGQGGDACGVVLALNRQN